MLYGTGLLALVELVLLVYCVLNVVTTPEDQVRNLPKLLWLFLVIVLPIVGGIAWLVAGRPVGPPSSVSGTGLPYKGNRGPAPLGGRPPRTTARTAPDDDEAFLRGLRERAEQQRRAERERRARAEGQDPSASRDGDDPRSPAG